MGKALLPSSLTWPWAAPVLASGQPVTPVPQGSSPHSCQLQRERERTKRNDLILEEASSHLSPLYLLEGVTGPSLHSRQGGNTRAGTHLESPFASERQKEDSHRDLMKEKSYPTLSL